MATVVLVHGAWHGAWCWHRVVRGLALRQLPAVAVELPLAGLGADADHVRAVLADIEGDVVLVGHSYGGFVVSRATSPDLGPTNVRHLVYLCAFQAQEDLDSPGMLAEHGSELMQGLTVTDAGLEVDDAALVPSLYADCGDDDIALARKSLRPMPLSAPVPERVHPGYETIPSTYVVCTQDRAIPPSMQRIFSQHADSVVEWPVSHSPFFSVPDDVVALLAGIAAPAA